MEFNEKTAYCQKMASAEQVASDKRLLEQVASSDSLLHAIGSGKEFDQQLLWVLLDYCTPEQIERNREGIQQPVSSSAVSAGLPVKTPYTLDVPVKKKFKKKRNTPISDGSVLKTKVFKKLLFYTTTALTRSAAYQQRSANLIRIPHRN